MVRAQKYLDYTFLTRSDVIVAIYEESAIVQCERFVSLILEVHANFFWPYKNSSEKHKTCIWFHNRTKAAFILIRPIDIVSPPVETSVNLSHTQCNRVCFEIHPKSCHAELNCFIVLNHFGLVISSLYRIWNFQSFPILLNRTVCLTLVLSFLHRCLKQSTVMALQVSQAQISHRYLWLRTYPPGNFWSVHGNAATKFWSNRIRSNQPFKSVRQLQSRQHISISQQSYRNWRLAVTSRIPCPLQIDAVKISHCLDWSHNQACIS